MKAFFGKIWSWILAHKIIAIVAASVLAIGMICAIVLPIALHEHSYSADWSTDANNHWHDAVCRHEEEKNELAAHIYDNDCDTTCSVCGYERAVGAHVYDNDCDTTCNVCGSERAVGAHVYDNACDTACNVCEATRQITHDHAEELTAGETTHWYACSVCGDKKDETAHVFDQTAATSIYLKAAATSTAKAQYYKSCVCGAASDTEYFETDKLPANLDVVGDISKTYDGTPVSEPEYISEGDGGEMFEYFKDGVKLTGAPTNAGTYTVVVTIIETETYAGDRVEKEFTIAKKIISNLELSFEYNADTYFEITYTNSDLADIAASDSVRFEIGTTDKNAGEYTLANGKLEEIVVDGDNDVANNYEVDLATAKVTVAKIVVAIPTLEKVYDGYGEFEFVFKGPANEEIDCAITIDGKNAGAYTDAAITYKSVSSDNYEIVATTASATITKRAIWIENAEFAYDGSTNRCGDEYPAGYFKINNLVAGEDPNAIQADITWSFDSKNVGATLTEVELTEEYHPNYTIDFSKCSAKIVKRAIWAENVEFTYNGYRIWSGEESSKEITFENLANGETMDSSFIVWTFSAKTAGSKLTSVSFMDEDDGRSNYTIDFSKCSAKIAKRAIWTTGAEFVYAGFDNFYGDAAKAAVTFENLVTGDALDAGDVWFKFKGADAGSAIEGLYFDGAGNNITDNYEFDLSKCTVSIVRAQLKFTLSVTDKEYNGYTVYPDIVGLPTWFDISGATITTDYKLSSENEDHYGMNNEPVTPGTYTVRVSISESNNYTSYVARAEFTIAKKALTLNLTYVYDTGAPITKLTAENGVVGNEVLFLELCYWQDYDKVGTYKLTDKIDSEPAGDHNLEGVSLFGDTKDYYTFTYDEDGYVGTFTLAPFVLDIPDNFVIEKTQDGTNYVTFTIFASNGYTLNRDVTVKIPMYFTLDGSPVTEYGTYSTQSGDPATEIYFGTPEFHINTVNKVDAFALPEKFEKEPVTVHIFDDRTLFIQMFSATGEQVDEDGLMKYRVTVAQGVLRVGDEIVAYSQTTGGKYSTVKIAGIEYIKTGKAVDFVNGTDWNEVYIYVENGPATIAPGSVIVLTHTDEELVYSDSIYVHLTVDSAQTMSLGNGFYISFINNRQYANYQCKPNEILGADEIAPGESAYVLIRLYGYRYYAADMELLITPGVMPANKFVGTATILSPIEAEQKVENGSLKMVVENIALEANQPTVIELTNEEFDGGIFRFVFNGVSASNVKIYASDGTVIDAEYQSTGANMLNFVLTSSGEVFTLAEGESMYIVIIPDSDTDSFTLTAF